MSEDAWHVVLVPAQGHVVCSCAGVGWCSHIDATLVAGERAMVPPEDRSAANRAQIAARGRIGPPADWKSHWRGNRRWRGLSPLRETSLDRSRTSGAPMMSIEGRGAARRAAAALSEEAGWMVVGSPVVGCLFHVMPDVEAQTRASARAREAGIPIASYAEWAGIAATLGDIMRHEIAARTAPDTKKLQDGEGMD